MIHYPGIEWLGDIPFGWEVKPFRHAMQGGTRNGLYKSSEYSDPDGTPIIQMGEAFASPIIQKTADDRLRLTAQEKETWGLQKNDLLFARRSLVFEGAISILVYPVRLLSCPDSRDYETGHNQRTRHTAAESNCYCDSSKG